MLMDTTLWSLVLSMVLTTWHHQNGGIAFAYVRCDVDAECPTGARCYLDDCARCECPLGYYVTNYVKDDIGSIEICIQDQAITKVGDPCIYNHTCPFRSICVGGTCECEPRTTAEEDLSICRKALFGERCGHVDCLDGLSCEGHPPLCRCAPSYTSPDPWRRFVDERWDIASINMYTDCMPRSVGDTCSQHSDCSNIDGSGALCLCHHCACANESHVPNVYGTVCGPPLAFGELCESSTYRINGVCDGRQGLHCGDTCDDYNGGDTRCTCSHMHDDNGTTCVPKSQGSRCGTDLDCYLMTDGFGICENRRCTIAANTTEHIPRNLDRECQHTTPTPSPNPNHSSTMSFLDTSEQTLEHDYESVTKGDVFKEIEIDSVDSSDNNKGGDTIDSSGNAAYVHRLMYILQTIALMCVYYQR